MKANAFNAAKEYYFDIVKRAEDVRDRGKRNFSKCNEFKNEGKLKTISAKDVK